MRNAVPGVAFVSQYDKVNSSLDENQRELDNEIGQNNRDRSYNSSLYFGPGFGCRVAERGHSRNGPHRNPSRCSDHCGRRQAGQKAIPAVAQFFGIRAA